MSNKKTVKLDCSWCGEVDIMGKEHACIGGTNDEATLEVNKKLNQRR